MSVKVRRTLTIILTVALLLYIVITETVPTYVDKKFNTVAASPPYNVGQEAKDLYSSLTFISDLHCDALLWKRNLVKRHDYGHVDFPRMQEANMALQAFTIVSKTPKNMNFDHNSGDTDNITTLFIAEGRPMKSWFSLKERAIIQCDQLYSYAESSDNEFRVITSSKELSRFIDDRRVNSSLIAGFIGIEGMQVLEGDLNNVEAVYKAGVRMMAPVHFFDNKLGGSAHGIKKGGLTDFGRSVIKEMERKHMIVDLAHASPKLIDDVLAIATRPIIVSHTGVKGTCDNIRNLSDTHLERIASNGGLIGIAAFEQADCGTTAAATARAIKYTADLIGVDHVALGSDFDGAIQTHYDVTGYPLLVEELLKLGVSHEEIRLIMGDNVKDFLLRNLPSS